MAALHFEISGSARSELKISETKIMSLKTAARLLLISGLICGWVQTISAQTADEVVEKYLAAIGGRAALGKLKSRSMVGTVTLSTPVGNVSGPVEVLNQAPSKTRSVMKLDLSGVGLGQVVVDQRFDGEAGYVLDTLQGNRAITGDVLENMKNSSFPNALLNYKETGSTVELGGKEKAGERDAYVLIGKPKSGPAIRLYIDAESYLPIKTVVKINVPQLGREVEQTSEFSDYREVDGVKIAFQVKSSSPLQTYVINFTKAEHNTDIDQSLFSKPAQ